MTSQPKPNSEQGEYKGLTEQHSQEQIVVTERQL